MAGSKCASRCSTRSSRASSPGFTYVVQPAQLRATAHRIADIIYEKLTGDAGVFSTRIAYIAKQGRATSCSSPRPTASTRNRSSRSNEPLLSPVWSPDGTRIAYVSLENKKPVVYVQSLSTGGRQVVANFRGSNSAPAWSPDSSTSDRYADQGRRIAALPDQRRRQRRATAHQLGGIDTEANFAA